MTTPASLPERFHGPLSRSVAALLVGLLAAPPAWAAAKDAPEGPPRPPSLTVVSYGVDDASAPAAARLLQPAERAVRAAGRHELAALSALLDPQGTAARAEKAAEGKAAYEAARKLYDDLEPQKAAAECNKALKAYESADLSTHFDELITAWTLRIASLIANAENKAAIAELGLMLPSGGKATFDPNVFAPDFIAQVKQRREELAKKSDLGFKVDSKPAAARVFVDGSYRGVTPLELSGLSPGEHFLTLLAPGFQPTQKRFRAGPAANEVAQLEPLPKFSFFQPRLEALKKEKSATGRAGVAKATAKDLAVDQVLVLGVKAVPGKELKVTATRVDAAGHELASQESSVPDDAKADEALEGLFSRVLTTDQKAAVASEDSQGGFRWRLRYTGFVLLGLGVGAAGGGAGLGVSAMNAASDYKSLKDAPQVNAVWDQRESDGRNLALAADLTYLASAVLVAAGATLVGLDWFGAAPAPEGEAKPEIRLEDKKPARSDDEAKAEEKKRADEKKQAEDDKKAADEKKVEEKKKAKDDKKADEKRAEEDRKAEEEKKAEEARRAEQRKKEEEERRKADEKRKADDKKKQQDKKIQDFDDLRDDR